MLGIVVTMRAAQGAPYAILLIGVSEALCPAVLGLMSYACATLVGAASAARYTARS